MDARRAYPRWQAGEIHVAKTSTYLNFPRETAQAFEFYRAAFGTEYAAPVMRFGDIPSGDDGPGIADADRDLIMNVQLPITGGHLLMGTDAPESMGFVITKGNNVHINLDPDTRAEADRLFAALAEGGTVRMPLEEQFWGDYHGSLVDRFGVQWMFNCSARE